MNQALSTNYPYQDVRNDNDTHNIRRLSLISNPKFFEADVFSLFGWNDLPETLKKAILTDMEAYRDELLGLYSSCCRNVMNRRKSVTFWIRAYQDGACSEQTALEALKINLDA